MYWGFTGATGGQVNLQQFCTALNPVFQSNFANNAACAPATLQFTSSSESFAPITNYDWDFGDGSSSNLAQPPPHQYNQPGAYQVHLKIKGLDGCENDSSKTIKIGDIPNASLTVADTCFQRAPRFSNSSPGFGVSYQWAIDGINAGVQPPDLSAVSQGSHSLEIIASSDFNCAAPYTASAPFLIKPLPQVDISFTQTCATVNFSGVQKDAATSISQWSWNFGDNMQSNSQNEIHNYQQPKQYPVTLSAVASNGCTSDVVTKTIDIPSAFAFAGNDTIVVPNYPFQLRGKGNGSFQWSPSNGLSNPNIANPTLMLTADETYILKVTTAEGCVATDSINLKAIKGPAIYVPTAFTPNGDQLNDILRPVYVGIKELERFTVFNRWGQMVFTTKDMGKGWNGSFAEKPLASGTYVWFIIAKNYLDQPVKMKGTVTVVR